MPVIGSGAVTGNSAAGVSFTPAGGLTSTDVQAAIAEAAAKGASGTTQTSQAGTTYTVVLADAQTVIRFTSASATTVTVPTNATAAFPVGTIVTFYAAGTGGVTVAPAGGVTIRNNVSALAQFAECSLRKDATDEWVRVG